MQQRLYVAAKPEVFTIGPLQRSLLNPDLEYYFVCS